MREQKPGSGFRRAAFIASLVIAGLVMPRAMIAQTPATDPNMTQQQGMDNDDDGMELGWLGLLGLAGLLGLRRRDNVDRYTTPRSTS